MVIIHNAFTFSHILDLKYVFLADLVNSRPNLTNPNTRQRLFAWDFFFSRWRYGAILSIPRCPVGKLDGNCLTEMEKQSARVSKSEVPIARYHDKITCLQMLWRELQGFTSPFYHPYKKRGCYWVNIILSETSTYKSLSPIILEQFIVTQQKSDQKWQG